MNKRTLLFVILVSCTFFLLNIYFSYTRDKERREELQKEHTTDIQEKPIPFEYAMRKAPIETLPLTEIYNEKNEVLFHGIQIPEGVLTLAWTKSLPEKIIVEGKEAVLATKDYILEGPVLYTTKSFHKIDVAELPKAGSFDVQLITFPLDRSSPAAFLTEYRDGTLHFPLEKPKTNAIAIYKTSDVGYLPFGFYENVGDLFIELVKLPLFAHVAKPHSLLPSQAPSSADGKQKFYVLENEYQQLVFTNKGAAIIEINLPFESKNNQKSVVKEIGFDRDILEQTKDNAYFPSVPYFTADHSQEHEKGSLGGYYPLLRRNLNIFGSSFKVAPEHYAMNIVSDYPEMGELLYEVIEFSPEKIVFETKTSLRKITKTYSLPRHAAPYCFDLSIKIEGVSKGLWLTSGVPDVEIMSNSSSPQIQYRFMRKGKTEVEKLDLPKAKEIITVGSVQPDWVVNSNGYLGIIMDPLNKIGPGYRTQYIPGETMPTRLSLIDLPYQPYSPSKYPGYEVLLPIPQESGVYKFRIYAGPFEENTLKKVDGIYTDLKTGNNPDYIATRTFYGFFSFISEPFAKLLFVVMKFFYALTSSWVAAIILLTIFLRILLYPLNAWSLKSMRRMQEISPQVQAIQKKHKKEPKKAQMEIMQLYREEKVNPFTGCLPILIQIPFLVGMFDLLKSSFQLRGASFIPGWIDNLTAPDVLFRWKQPIFFIGTEFHLLPIILGVVMFVQQRISSPHPKDVSELTDQQRQQRAMGTMMAVLFTVMFYNFPSGLNIYWLSSMLLGIGQQWLTNKYLAKKKAISTKEIIPKHKRLKKS